MAEVAFWIVLFGGIWLWLVRQSDPERFRQARRRIGRALARATGLDGER